MVTVMEKVHTWLYRIGSVSVFLFFLGFMVFVVITAQSRKSGSTGQRVSELHEHRKAAELVESETEEQVETPA